MKLQKIKCFKFYNFLFVLILLFSIQSTFARKSDKVLIFSKIAGFRHLSIPAGIKAIIKLGEENGFSVDTTTNSKQFTSANLKKYKAVIFLNPTGDVLNNEQQLEFEQYIKGGGGFVGIHSATDCEYDWSWYGNLVGAYFGSHPNQQEAVLKVTDQKHISTKHLPKEWKRKDEWYNYKWISKDLNVLISIDESSYDAGKGKMGNNHPMAWYHDYDGGRAFYTSLGHTNESYQETLFLQHLLGGIKYAMGNKK
jgi:type 1 glutamine amidotransferase